MRNRLFAPTFILLVLTLVLPAVLFMPSAVLASNHVGEITACQPGESDFLGFPYWYRGLQCEDDGTGGVVFMELTDTWVVLANVFDIALRIAGLLAVVFIIYGGIRYITSQGEPESLQAAKKTLTNAIVGLVIAILASTIVGFIAGQF